VDAGEPTFDAEKKLELGSRRLLWISGNDFSRWILQDGHVAFIVPDWAGSVPV
jgi:hypothetical protein